MLAEVLGSAPKTYSERKLLSDNRFPPPKSDNPLWPQGKSSSLGIPQRMKVVLVGVAVYATQIISTAILRRD